LSRAPAHGHYEILLESPGHLQGEGPVVEVQAGFLEVFIDILLTLT